MAPTPCKEDPELERFRAEELVATAWHEAGHAVLLAVWDLPFECVEVFSEKYPAPPELKGKYTGIVRNDWVYGCPGWWVRPRTSSFRIKDATKHWDRLICFSLAGVQAEWHHSLNTGCRMAAGTGGHDQREIRFLFRHLMGFPMASLKAYLVPLRLRTFDLLKRPAVWQAVTAVAEALLDRSVLTRDEVLALVDRTCPPATACRSKVPSARSKSVDIRHRSIDNKQRRKI